ncbi:MAG: glutathione S-transferase family protein, partial [Planctomycetota bacterium]
MITVYSNQASANCFKVRLLLHQLEIPFRVVEIDILKERPVDFLAKNPGGKVPFVELEDGTGLTESDAMLYYFAQGSALWPSDRLERTRVLQWMFFEQNEHEPNIAVARFWCGILGAEKEYEAALVLLEEHPLQDACPLQPIRRPQGRA